MSCSICVDDYNKINREVICIACNLSCCKRCFRRYTTDPAHYFKCMGCGYDFDRASLYKIMGVSFMNKEFKTIRESILFEREKTFFPATQLLIEQEQEIQRLYESIDEVEAKYKYLKQTRIQQLSDFIKSIEMMRIDKCIEEYEARKESLNVSDLMDDEVKVIKQKITKLQNKEEKVTRTFVRKCPHTECVGMLSLEKRTSKQNFMCKICSFISCANCREIIKNNDEANHTCNEEVLKTISFIEETSKPCPSCNSPIHKIHGCFDKNTIIPLANGMNKCVYELKVGDQLIGDDHTIRTVLHTFDGIDDLYEVRQSNGETYIVNSMHTLVLRNPHGRVFAIRLDIFMELDDETKSQRFGYKIDPFTNEITNSTIEVNRYKRGKYYGFTLDGNNKFLYTDGTVLSNCNQMFCTNCHTAFSWNTLRINRGTIHNPHWYEWQRSIGRANTRNPLDLQCGQELTDHHIPSIMIAIKLLVIGTIDKPRSGCREVRDMTLEQKKELHGQVDHMEQLMIRIIHHHNVSIPRYQNVAQHAVNQDWRMKLLKKVIDENTFRINIQRVDKAENKKQDILNVLVTFRTAGTDITYRFMRDIDSGVFKTLEQLQGYLQEFYNLEQYINGCLLEIKNQYQSQMSTKILEI